MIAITTAQVNKNMEWIKYLTVAGLSASPWGEELVAIPGGILLGLNPGAVLLLCVAANFLPVLVLIFLMKKAQEVPALQEWLLRKKSDRIKSFMDRHGVLGLVLLTPWVGVYAVTITCELLGMDRLRSLLAQGISLILYGFAALAFTLMGVEGFNWITHRS